MKINDLRDFTPALASIFGQGQHAKGESAIATKEHREHKERSCLLCALCALLWLIISQFPGPLSRFPNPLQNVKEQAPERRIFHNNMLCWDRNLIYTSFLWGVDFLAHPALAGRAVCLLRSSHASGQTARKGAV
jgi:hypothetical protein